MSEWEIDVLRDIRDKTIPVNIYSKIMVPVDIQEATDIGRKRLRHQYCETLTILPSATRTSSGQSGAFDVTGYREANFYLDVTGITGTLSGVTIQTYDPVGGDWYPLDVYGQFTTTGNSMILRNSNLGCSIRAAYGIISGSTVTFSLSAIVKT